MKNALGGIAALVALTLAILFAIMWAAGIGVFSAKTNAVVAKKTLNSRITTALNTPENAIASYERFYTECRGIVALNQQIDSLAQRHAELQQEAQGNDPFGQKAHAAADALADLTGAKNQRANVASSYNARSAQYTTGQFKDARLPYRIDPPYQVACG